jgi:predicted amino acid racemase
MSEQEVKDTDLDLLEKTIRALYAPAQNAQEADEIMLTIDLADAINPILDFDRNELFDVMKEIGFKHKTIEGSLYWLLKEI